jgi:hypothetical protein
MVPEAQGMKWMIDPSLLRDPGKTFKHTEKLLVFNAG